MAITARRTEEEEEEQTPMKTKITQQQHQQQQVDRISELPDDILHTILSIVTLKEACITSTLSKRWRNLFPSLPRLVFDDLSFFSSFIRLTDPWGHEIDLHCWPKSVWAILESRRSPVRICTIRSYYLDMYREEDLGNIIRFLCNDGIQELTIANMGEHYTFPSCLYLCPTPTRIELRRCILKVPSNFTGLRRLNALKIEQCMVEDGDLQRLILGCRALDSLTLVHCYGLRNLVVDSHTLTVLDVSSRGPCSVSIGKAPRLESVTVRFRYDYPEMYPEDSSDIDDGTGTADGGNYTEESEVSRLVRLLESLGDIQNLSLEFQSTCMEELSTEGVQVTVTLQSLLPKMKKLTLKMQRCETTMFSIVSCLLNSCPNLEDLVVVDVFDFPIPEDSALEYWDQQMSSDCMTNTLSTVTLYLDDVCCWEYWINLLKFLLNNACVLKNLVWSVLHTPL